jgi:hypothetical protein
METRPIPMARLAGRAAMADRMAQAARSVSRALVDQVAMMGLRVPPVAAPTVAMAAMAVTDSLLRLPV